MENFPFSSIISPLIRGFFIATFDYQRVYNVVHIFPTLPKALKQMSFIMPHLVARGIIHSTRPDEYNASKCFAHWNLLSVSKSNIKAYKLKVLSRNGTSSSPFVTVIHGYPCNPESENPKSCHQHQTHFFNLGSRQPQGGKRVLWTLL